jgi:hypothetical protein
VCRAVDETVRKEVIDEADLDTTSDRRAEDTQNKR